MSNSNRLPVKMSNIGEWIAYKGQLSINQKITLATRVQENGNFIVNQYIDPTTGVAGEKYIAFRGETASGTMCYMKVKYADRHKLSVSVPVDGERLLQVQVVPEVKVVPEGTEFVSAGDIQ